jgi:hypothetical protein
LAAFLAAFFLVFLHIFMAGKQYSWYQSIYLDYSSDLCHRYCSLLAWLSILIVSNWKIYDWS